jgi:hypothetical protein
MTLIELQLSAERRGADAATARIVAWLREIADADEPMTINDAAVFDVARRIERGEHAQPEPARQTCGECDYDPDHLYHDCADNPGTKPEPTHEDGECPVRP